MNNKRVDGQSMPKETFAVHYHVISGAHDQNRAIFYHDHVASYVFDDDGHIVHNHDVNPAHYVGRPAIYSDDAPGHNSATDVHEKG